jgi:hypothetical protein
MCRTEHRFTARSSIKDAMAAESPPVLSDDLVRAAAAAAPITASSRTDDIPPS